MKIVVGDMLEQVGYHTCNKYAAVFIDDKDKKLVAAAQPSLNDIEE